MSYAYLELILEKIINSCGSRIMFLREFTVIDSAVSVEQLRMRLKENELEQYGEAFIPEFVYEVIRRLPRFSSMRVSGASPFAHFLELTVDTEGPPARCRRIPGVST